MMKTFALKAQLNLDLEIIKESNHLEAKAKELEKKKPEIEKEMKKLEDGLLWESAEAFRKAQAVGSADLPSRYAEYMRLLNQKNSVLTRYQRERDHIRVKLDALMFEAKAEVAELFDREIQRLLARKVIQHPLPHAHGYLDRIQDFERVDMRTGVVWLKIFSNGPAIQEAVEILSLAKGKLPNVVCASDLLALLDDSDSKLNELSFELQAYEIKKSDYEFHDPKRLLEFQTYVPAGDALAGVKKISKDGKPLSFLGELLEDDVGFHRPK